MIFGRVALEESQVPPGLHAQIEGFVRAGGRVTGTEWALMAPIEREIMVNAAEKVFLEREVAHLCPELMVAEFAKSLPKEESAKLINALILAIQKGEKK